MAARRHRFDVERSGAWPERWGRRPAETPDAPLVAEKEVAAAPVLVPVYARRCMLDSPPLPGNPVFSVVQLDVIRHGDDLPSYLREEFGVPPPNAPPGEPRTIELWDYLVLDNR